MANTSIWKGTETMQEDPGSPHLVTSANGRSMTRRFTGKYSDLMSAQPDPGMGMDGVPGDLEVAKVEVIKGKATTGKMIVHLVSQADGFATSPGTPPSIYEIDSGQLEKPLSSHKLYATGGTYALLPADLDAVEEWRNKTSAADRATAFAALSANAKNLATKIQRGQESYLVPAPIARKTSPSWKPANPGATGKTGTPTGFGSALPSGYKWLKVTDRATRTGNSGRWERVEEWQAADDWDVQIYPPA